jgi:hypothetical protein
MKRFLFLLGTILCISACLNSCVVYDVTPTPRYQTHVYYEHYYYKPKYVYKYNNRPKSNKNKRGSSYRPNAHNTRMR